VICVGLIRGINVGHAKRVPMAELRALVEGLGCTNVRTLLNSGNLVFGAGRKKPASLAPAIAKAMADGIGVSAQVVVITAKELAAIVDDNPLPDATAEPSRFLVSVPADASHLARLKPLLREDWAPDALAIGRRAAYLRCAKGILDSPLAAAVTRSLGADTTARNWTTLSKLRAMADDVR